jgi:hypothetical protein
MVLSLGSLWRLGDQIHNSISAKKLGFSGLEWNPHPEDVNRIANAKATLRLPDFQRTTCHCIDLRGLDDWSLLRAISNMYYIAPHGLCIHPDHLPDQGKDGLRSFVPWMIENLNPESGIGLDVFHGLMSDGRFTACLDTAHSFGWSGNLFKELMVQYKGRVDQIHLSSRIGTVDHRPICDSPTKFLDSIECLKGSTIPIVIEEDFDNLDDLIREADFVEKWLRP